MEHLQPFRRPLIKCLSTCVAEYTRAHILDGQSICYKYAGDHYSEDSWPVMQHKEIHSDKLEKARAFRSDFDVLSLKFDANVRPQKGSPRPCMYGFVDLLVHAVQAYQDTSPISTAWNL